MQLEINTKYGQDIFFISNKSYGIESVYKLIQENEIENIDYDLEQNPKTLEYDSNFKIKTSPQLQVNPSLANTGIMQMNGFENQTIFDLITMAYFDIGQAYKFIQDNNISNINEGAFNGKTFNFNERFIADKGMFDSFLKNGLIINTGENKTTEPAPQGNFILRTDGGYLLRVDGGKFIRF